MPIICPSCGAENHEHATFCNLCCSVVGFESAEYTTPPDKDEGYQSDYPSSFKKGAPAVPDEEFTRMPKARPVEIGDYGVRSGHQVPEPPRQEKEVPPVDIGQYGVRSGAPAGTMGPEDETSPGGGRRRGLFGRRRGKRG